MTGRITPEYARRRETLYKGPLTDYFVAEIEYEYCVKDQKYRCSNITFAGFADWLSSRNILSGMVIRMNPLLNYYPVGKLVRVYYQPDDPKTAVLIPGYKSDIPKDSDIPQV